MDFTPRSLIWNIYICVLCVMVCHRIFNNIIQDLVRMGKCALYGSVRYVSCLKCVLFLAVVPVGPPAHNCGWTCTRPAPAPSSSPARARQGRTSDRPPATAFKFTLRTNDLSAEGIIIRIFGAVATMTSRVEKQLFILHRQKHAKMHVYPL